ncbi:hypothetical protein JCM10908_003200 [Rhodotorula pacifica]|uniref:uncharacterized protein n=1 Tax=Rhodotorula pacifica TaxID=1495444 RepID=UPI003173D5D5
MVGQVVYCRARLLLRRDIRALAPPPALTPRVGVSAEESFSSYDSFARFMHHDFLFFTFDAIDSAPSDQLPRTSTCKNPTTRETPVPSLFALDATGPKTLQRQSAAMSYELQASLPTQCAKLTLAWSGPAGGKRIETWVEGDSFFAEQIAANVSGTLGTVDWVCDIPAGARIAFEIYKLPGGQPYGTTPFYTVQPGTTDACLRQNPGQLAINSMAALASSLSSASPQLFTGYSTSPTSTTSTPTSTSSAAATSASSSPEDQGSSVSTSALVGGIVGGVAGLVLAALALWWLRRRSRRSRASDLGGATSYGASTTAFEHEKDLGPPLQQPITPSAGPVNAWLGRVQPGARPPSVWTRKSGTISFRNAINGLAARSPIGGGGAFTSTSGSQQQQQAPRSQGPRADLPEVGEAGDFGAFSGGYGGGSTGWQQHSSAPSAPTPHYAPVAPYPPSSSDAVLPLPSTLQPRNNSNNGSVGSPGFSSQAAPVPPLVQTPSHDAAPQRPPTRLTTPGGFSMHGGGGGTGDAHLPPIGGYIVDEDGQGQYASRPVGVLL